MRCWCFHMWWSLPKLSIWYIRDRKHHFHPGILLFWVKMPIFVGKNPDNNEECTVEVRTKEALYTMLSLCLLILYDFSTPLAWQHYLSGKCQDTDLWQARSRTYQVQPCIQRWNTSMCVRIYLEFSPLLIHVVLPSSFWASLSRSEKPQRTQLFWWSKANFVYSSYSQISKAYQCV